MHLSLALGLLELCALSAGDEEQELVPGFSGHFRVREVVVSHQFLQDFCVFFFSF